MDGCSGHYSKRNRERQISYDRTWNLKKQKNKKETEKWTLRYREEIGGYEMDGWNGWRGSKGTKFQL